MCVFPKSALKTSKSLKTNKFITINNKMVFIKKQYVDLTTVEAASEYQFTAEGYSMLYLPAITKKIKAIRVQVKAGPCS